jgi:predicted transcriptional regulator of viral defense system
LAARTGTFVDIVPPHVYNYSVVHRTEIKRLPATFRFAEARKAGLSKHAIYQLRATGDLVSLGAGLYRKAEAQQAVDIDLIALALRAPLATLCLASALARHELVDTIPSAVDVALPRGTRSPQATAPPVKWHVFDPSTFQIGRETVKLDADTSIGIYSAERSIVDAFRLRGVVGPELGREALRAWLRRRGAQPAVLLNIAKSFANAERSLREALEFLL